MDRATQLSRAQERDTGALKYLPLTHPRHIRIICLEPAAFDDEISCRLTHVNLLGSPSYEALSYVWGNPNTIGSIFCDGTVVEVTVNLKAALKRLRHPFEEVPCWIDALCINQSDPDEKSNQVMLMGLIYSKALNVVIYLCEKDANSEATLTILGALRGASLDMSKTNEEIHDILNRCYYGGPRSRDSCR